MPPLASVNDTKQAARLYMGCVKEKGSAACGRERAAVVEGASAVAKTECAPYVEDFFKCFTHRYKLNSCNDATTAKRNELASTA